MRVLLVEDEPRLSATLSVGLKVGRNALGAKADSRSRRGYRRAIRPGTHRFRWVWRNPLVDRRAAPESEAALHDLGVPMDVGAPTARKVVRDAGHKFSNEVVVARSQTAKSARAYG